MLLVLFVIQASYYTYREPNRVINYQFITEEHHERYIDAEEVYERERRLRGVAAGNDDNTMNRVDHSDNQMF